MSTTPGSATLLNALSPQLQALVEASLGEKLQIRPARQAPKAPAVREAAGDGSEREKTAVTHRTAQVETPLKPDMRFKLNPSELFVLQHPTSPGFVVKEGFLGIEDAHRVRAALLALAERASFHDAGVGHGTNFRQEQALRGDRIHWIQRDNKEDLNPAISLLLRRIESLVYGVKNAVPELQLRNVTSTQLAIFPGDGSRFVRHTDTYASAHAQHRSSVGGESTELVRRLTCVYYLNDDWVPEHQGHLRVYTKQQTVAPRTMPPHWDVAPRLDTLVVFRSTDVEHEVLPAFHERMALTTWYYGPPPSPSPSCVAPATSRVERKTDGSIFVAIPSYRDPECAPTVIDLFRKASDPSRLSVGICLQSENEHKDELKLREAVASALGERSPRPEQLRIRWLHFSEAAGPCVARAEAQSLWTGEQYYLQIDSHMRFRDAWDSFLIDELHRCPSHKAVLTTYPLGYTLPDHISSDSRPTLLCASRFDEDGTLRQASKTLAKKADSPLPSLFWAAGFAFSSSQVVEEVPYDASLRFLFFGEESSMSARLWTHGWDFFAPREMPIYHLWSRAYRPVFQELETKERRQTREESLRRVADLLLQRGDDSNATFGLGAVRTMQQYEQHIGVSFATQTIEWRAEWGGLDPIQFDLSCHSPH
ncbi:hypothetical protein PINS_up002543 [Pythium insidiosum]|nr:hypothetical protein PINS_up002543 [Pythium insidiosum]